ncbi:class I SAM-dependent methyltransferase [Shewanella sp. Scap07]|uniref:class I SAM-dependent methyltransferase n=1 Tax=Shewanella sp. Scap07 TaxID=2589987 RepID=UPI0015BA6543|nr:class I SAM-dependent methyltransferase [Shewanella sp. Scap07]QLE85177.1 class I SAM-dependent methyltransferase [Shewanella sp. Scap07]
MKPIEIAAAYDRLTHLWSKDSFNHQNGLSALNKAIGFVSHKTKLSPSDLASRAADGDTDTVAQTSPMTTKFLTAIDIGCGCTGRFSQLLDEHQFKVTGLDISTQMLRLAKQRHIALELADVDFIQADICLQPLSQQYDLIIAWDSIWHVPLTEQAKVLTHIVNSLTDGGVFIFSFGGTEQAGEHVDDAMGQQVYYSSLGTAGFVGLFNTLGCQLRHLEFDQHPELHAYMIVEKVTK